MFEFIRRHMKGPSISTRLSENDVLEIALEAAQREGLMDAVLVPEPRTVGGRIVWIIGSTERGLSWWVEVDDATGEASPIHYPPAA